MCHFMLVILEPTPPPPYVHKWQNHVHPTPPLQEKQGPFFLWLQAGFRSLCPLIYQRTAVLILCDDQSSLPSVSLAQSLFYLPLCSSIFSYNLLFSFFCLSYPIIPPISVSILHSLLSAQIVLATLCNYSQYMEAVGFDSCVSTHTY